LCRARSSNTIAALLCAWGGCFAATRSRQAAFRGTRRCPAHPPVWAHHPLSVIAFGNSTEAFSLGALSRDPFASVNPGGGPWTRRRNPSRLTRNPTDLRAQTTAEPGNPHPRRHRLELAPRPRPRRFPIYVLSDTNQPDIAALNRRVSPLRLRMARLSPGHLPTADREGQYRLQGRNSGTSARWGGTHELASRSTADMLPDSRPRDSCAWCGSCSRIPARILQGLVGRPAIDHPFARISSNSAWRPRHAILHSASPGGRPIAVVLGPTPALRIAQFKNTRKSRNCGNATVLAAMC